MNTAQWLRPRPARWFEALVARDDATLALQALAATGAVELEARPGAAPPPGFAELGAMLQAYGELALRYRAWWPREGSAPSAFPQPPAAALRAALDRLAAWAAVAEPLILRLQRLEAESAPLVHWHAAALALAGSPLAMAQLAAAGPLLQARLVAANADSRTPTASASGLLLLDLAAGEQPYRLAVGTAAEVQAFEAQQRALGLPCFAPPRPAFAATLADATAVGALQQAAAHEMQALHAAIDELSARHGLGQALADVARLQWVLHNVRALESGPLLSWITGWTSAANAAALEQSLEASGARALVHFAPPPAASRAPMLFANPWWARPFEVFARAMGVPSPTEADPSALLALAVPLMFGYMFGDVGQGLLIAAAGWALRRRFAIARLFVSGGLAAAGFGLAFGSVFGLHLLPPWWLAPLDDPLAVLLAPLFGGAVLLTVGLLLAALEAQWRGELGRWFGSEAGLLMTYLALLAAFAWPAALAIAAAGALLFCAGQGWQQRSVFALAAAAGELLERLVQLLVNTLSFARVGAFALAHAGLSAAIVALMDAAPPLAAVLVLVASNALVMLLEGLVVAIQTTRLVLFEFFTRFLHAEGRVFRPLPPPPSHPSPSSIPLEHIS